MKFDNEDIMLCTECDAEFTVHRLDDDGDDSEVEFCPYCGNPMGLEYDEDEADDVDGVHYND